jgi:hypothetical protein
MDDVLFKIKLLQGDIERVLNDYMLLNEQQNLLKKTNEQLQVENLSLRRHEELLQDELKSLKLAQSLSGSDDQGNRELKNQINYYIREVDKCLQLLKSDLQ